MLPVKTACISQEYGRPNTKYKKGFHTGLDIVADGTDKNVYSAGIGVVLAARYLPTSKGADPDGWGNYVIVRQPDGHDVIYAHLSTVSVSQGKAVVSGQKIGVQGSTGNSTGPHLHFEVRQGNWQDCDDVNAADYLGIKNQVGPTQEKEDERVEKVNVVENGRQFDAYRIEGKTYVELKQYALAEGKDIAWDEPTKTATVTGGKLAKIKSILEE